MKPYIKKGWAYNKWPKPVIRELDKMKDIGVIRRVGPTFGGHWEILKEL